MITRCLVLAGVLALSAGCTDVVDREPGRIAIAVPSAYKVDNARVRADHYCERQSGQKAELVRTDSAGHDAVAYFECR